MGTVHKLVRKEAAADLFALGMLGEDVGPCNDNGRCGGTLTVCELREGWAVCWCTACGREARVPIRKARNPLERKELSRAARDRFGCSLREAEQAIEHQGKAGGQ